MTSGQFGKSTSWPVLAIFIYCMCDVAWVTQESELLGLGQYSCRRSTQPCQDLPKSPLWGSCAGHHHICPAPDSGSGGDHRHCRLEARLLCILGKAGTALALPVSSAVHSWHDVSSCFRRQLHYLRLAQCSAVICTHTPRIFLYKHHCSTVAAM